MEPEMGANGVVDQADRLVVSVAQVEDERLERSGPSQDEGVVARACRRMRLFGQLPGRLEVGVEGADRGQVQGQRAQALVADLGRELQGAGRRVVLDIE